MKDLMQAVLEDESVRQPGAINVAASQAAAEFAPWAALDAE